MSVSYWNDQSDGQKLFFDIAIIGGGITGLSCAHWLLKEDPSLKIGIIEKYEIGSGATGRNAGFITCGSVEHFNRLVTKHGQAEALEIWRFSETNLALLKEEIIQGNEEQFLFEQKGSFSLASTDTELNELKESARLMGTMAINVEELSKRQVATRLGAKGFAGGIKYCDDASIHPIALLNEMRKNLSKKISILTNNEVHRIDTLGESKIIHTNKNKIETSLVILATNGYSPLLHPFFETKVFPTRAQILTTSPVKKFMEGPCYANFVLDYFRQLPTGELIIGGFRQLQKDVEKGYSDETTDVIQKALEQFLRDHLPSVSKAPITHRWSGIMGFSVDGQPMVGSLPGDPQFFFCCGFTGHGLGLAFHSAKVLVDCIYGRSIPNFISARRF